LTLGPRANGHATGKLAKASRTLTLEQSWQCPQQNRSRFLWWYGQAAGMGAGFSGEATTYENCSTFIVVLFPMED
jgi:hypothetical protein